MPALILLLLLSMPAWADRAELMPGDPRATVQRPAPPDATVLAPCAMPPCGVSLTPAALPQAPPASNPPAPTGLAIAPR